MEEDEERGWSSGGEKWVCAEHVEDEALARLIAEQGSSTTCSYCDRREPEPSALALDLLIERIATSIPSEWGHADDEGVGWEGGYVGETYDSYDLLTDALEGPLNHEELISDVAAALPQHSWAQRDFYRLRPDERLRSGWEEFGDVVKNRRRYFFMDYQRDAAYPDPDYVRPGEMLEAIGAAVQDGNLVRELEAGLPLFRVRAHSADENPRTAAELGSPPAAKIRSSSRMSAAGIPMFYGAFDQQTATTETRGANPQADAFTLGRFELRRPALVIDLSIRPDVPSLFDPDGRHLRSALIFLRYFAEAISEPFVRDDRIHIEYVPTQVVTEWLRTHFDSSRGPIDGVAYQSARERDRGHAAEGTNVALFIDSEGACEPGQETDEAVLLLTDSERIERPGCQLFRGDHHSPRGPGGRGPWSIAACASEQ